MILRIYSGSKNLQDKDCSAIYYGPIQSMMKRVPALTNSLRMTLEAAPTSLDSKRRTISCTKIDFCLYWGHMKLNLMVIRCTSGTEHRNFQLLSQYLALLTIVMCIITRAQSSNLNRIHWISSNLITLLTLISYRTSWMFSHGRFHLWLRRSLKCW